MEPLRTALGLRTPLTKRLSLTGNSDAPDLRSGCLGYVQATRLKTQGPSLCGCSNTPITRIRIETNLRWAHRRLWFQGVGLMINAPTIKFSPWYRWEQRHDFLEMGRRGVYIIAHSKSAPRLAVPWLSPKVIYIGETHGGMMNLRKRLGKFHRAAQKGKGNHAGGRSYHREKFDPEFPNIYFSVIPCALQDQKLSTAWIYYVERKLIWEYASKHRELPICNSK